jgi:hypothetical protein
MGRISRFDLRKIIEDYDTRFFFETGTWKGDAVAYALQFPFDHIYSVEIIPEIAREAGDRFAGFGKVKVFQGASRDVFADQLAGIRGNCLFWLDAHFPGAEAGMNEYDAEQDESLRLPLEREIRIIHAMRKAYRDVLIIDDLRLFEEGQYQNGAAPSDTLPRNPQGLGFVQECFGDSHTFIRSYMDEGYLLLLPGKAASGEGQAGNSSYFLSPAAMT